MKKSCNLKKILSVILPIVFLMGSVGYLVFRLMNERRYREKWKDYEDCGLI
ncbi:MAG: hypothetical protein RSB36_00330 [Hydrogenoanaerobacterium sp.]